MNWWALSTLFVLSTFKFMFAPFGGPDLGLSFLETYISCVSGGIFGAAIFYFSAEFFMKKSHEKRKLKHQLMLEKGTPIKHKKKFTRANRFIIKLKRSIGILGITLWAPFFLSVPIGSIVAAKFYGHKKNTFLLIIAGMLINGIITSSISFLIRG